MVERICPWGSERYSRITPEGASRFHYFRLPDGLKKPYLEIEKGMLSRERTIESGLCDSDSVRAVMTALMLDDPLVLSTSFEATVSSRGSNIMPSYTYSAKESDRILKAVAERAASIGTRTSGMTDFEKELYVHDHLAGTVAYDPDCKGAYDIAGPLLWGRGVCMGISKAASLLLNSIGVDASVVTGECRDGEKHAWNLVHLDGNYHLDVTWDLTRIGGMRSHCYFNLADHHMRRSRSWDGNFVANGTAFNYHSMKGAVMRDMADIDRLLARSIDDRLTAIEYRLSGSLMAGYDPDAVLKRVARLCSCSARCTHFYVEDIGCHFFNLDYYR